LPINCSDFTWYEQFGANNAQEVPVICFKISYSDPFLAITILFSFQSFLLPLLFRTVLFIHLKVWPRLCLCRWKQCLPMILLLIQPVILVILINIKIFIGINFFAENLNLFGERISTTVRVSVSIIAWLNFPPWIALNQYRVEENGSTMPQNYIQRHVRIHVTEREPLTT
jgi:hypothetical protein